MALAKLVRMDLPRMLQHRLGLRIGGAGAGVEGQADEDSGNLLDWT